MRESCDPLATIPYRLQDAVLLGVSDLTDCFGVIDAGEIARFLDLVDALDDGSGDFPALGFGELVYEEDLPGTERFAEYLTDLGNQFLAQAFTFVISLVEDDVRNDCGPFRLVGRANGDSGHRLVFDERILYFGRTDPPAGDDQHVAGPIVKEPESVCVLPGPVTVVPQSPNRDQYSNSPHMTVRRDSRTK